jgi:hypothetical protein
VDTLRAKANQDRVYVSLRPPNSKVYRKQFDASEYWEGSIMDGFVIAILVIAVLCFVAIGWISATVLIRVRRRRERLQMRRHVQRIEPVVWSEAPRQT